jgi:TolA-binding protein
VLIPEALYGRGRALTGLGDRAEETRTWQRLLRDFPDSAYAEPARRRLAELE